MGTKKYTTGEELFGSKIESPYSDYELYDSLSAELTLVCIKLGRLLEDGPEVDIETLETLIEQRKDGDEVATTKLQTLSQYKAWFRYLRATKVRDFPGELDPKG